MLGFVTLSRGGGVSVCILFPRRNILSDLSFRSFPSDSRDVELRRRLMNMDIVDIEIPEGRRMGKVLEELLQGPRVNS